MSLVDRRRARAGVAEAIDRRKALAERVTWARQRPRKARLEALKLAAPCFSGAPLLWCTDTTAPPSLARGPRPDRASTHWEFAARSPRLARVSRKRGVLGRTEAFVPTLFTTILILVSPRVPTTRPIRHHVHDGVVHSAAPRLNHASSTESVFTRNLAVIRGLWHRPWCEPSSLPVRPERCAMGEAVRPHSGAQGGASRAKVRATGNHERDAVPKADWLSVALPAARLSAVEYGEEVLLPMAGRRHLRAGSRCAAFSSTRGSWARAGTFHRNRR